MRSASTVVDRADELLVGGVLDDVALRAELEGLARVGRLVLHREDHDPRAALAQVGDRVESRAVAQRQVEHDDVRVQRARLLERLADAGGLADDLEAPGRLEHALDAAADDLVIVDEQDADHAELDRDLEADRARRRPPAARDRRGLRPCARARSCPRHRSRGSPGRSPCRRPRPSRPGSRRRSRRSRRRRAPPRAARRCRAPPARSGRRRSRPRPAAGRGPSPSSGGIARPLRRAIVSHRRSSAAPRPKSSSTFGRRSAIRSRTSSIAAATPSRASLELRALLVVGDLALEAAQREQHRGQAAGRAVVQVLREPPALALLRLDHARQRLAPRLGVGLRLAQAGERLGTRALACRASATCARRSPRTSRAPASSSCSSASKSVPSSRSAARSTAAGSSPTTTGWAITSCPTRRLAVPKPPSAVGSRPSTWMRDAREHAPSRRTSRREVDRRACRTPGGSRALPRRRSG